MATARPDEVAMMLEVAAIEDDAATAFADVAQRTEELERVLDEHAIAEGARSTTGIGVQGYSEYDPQGAPRTRHRAVNRISIRLPDAEQVPRLLRASVERARAEVQGPWWRLAEDNPARLEACRLAAAEAARRAEAYATELGLRLGAVEHVAEAAARHEIGQPHVSFGVSEGETPLHPGELEATATVEVTYATEPA